MGHLTSRNNDEERIHYGRSRCKIFKMSHTFKVFKKSSLDGHITVYLGKREFVDNISSVEAIDGVIVVNEEYLKNRKIFAQLICSFRYGREEDEVMGLKFQKDMTLVSQPVTVPTGNDRGGGQTKLQVRLVRNLTADHVTARPFTLQIPLNAPASVTLQPGPDTAGRPCGVEYFVKVFTGDDENDRSHKRSTVQLAIRKIQYAPSSPGIQPTTVVRKDFMLSPGQLILETTLDKQLYHHGEKITVNIFIRNNSNKTVRKVRVAVQQCIDVCIFSGGQYKATVASIETQEGCPLAPGSSLKKTVQLVPTLGNSKDRRGIALDGQLKREDTNLASSTLLSDPDQRDAFGIIVSYILKVKLFLGAVGGELASETPFILMHPKPAPKKMIRADSEAGVVAFRLDTIPSEETILED